MSELVDLGNAPEFTFDGIGDAYVVNGIMRIALYQWRRVNGRPVRVVCAWVNRPAVLPEGEMALVTNAPQMTRLETEMALACH